jgi:hypothetical protein
MPDPNFSIPDPGSKKIPDPGSGSASRDLSFLTQKIFLSSQKCDLGCSSRIRIPDPNLDFIPIPDPVSGSTTLMSIFPIFLYSSTKEGGGLIIFY